MLEEGEVDWWWWLGRSWTSSKALRLFRAQRASPSLWPYRGCIGDFSPVERELVFWYAICMESLSPEFEAPNLKNGRDLHRWLRVYSLMKIGGVSRFLGALPPQPLRKFRGRTHTWTGWSYHHSGGFEWVQGGLGSVPRQFQGCSAQKVVAGESITLTVIRLNWRLFSISLRLKPWYTIYIESLSPEVEKSHLKNGRMLRGRNRIYSLMKI